MSGRITIEHSLRTRGVTQMDTFISASDEIPKYAFPLIVIEMMQIGVAAGKASIKSTTGEKSTGHLEKSFRGVIQEINDEHHRVAIGSDLDYAQYAAEGAGPVVQNRAVQIWPGPVRWGFSNAFIWRFIGQRPAIKSHPFMQDTAESISDKLDRVVSKYLKRGWQRANTKGKGAPPVP